MKKSQLKKILEDSFGEKVDFQDKYFIIKVGDVLIKNSSGMSYLAEDFYVKLHLTENKKSEEVGISDIEITRAKCHIKEITSGFCHPHGGAVGQFTQNFCYGDGPLMGLMRKVSSDITEVNLKKFIAGIYAYLSWENTQDCPNPIGRLGNELVPVKVREIDVASSAARRRINKLWALLKENEKELKKHLSLTTSKGKVGVSLKPSFREFVGALVEKNVNLVADVTGLCCTIDNGIEVTYVPKALRTNEKDITKEEFKLASAISHSGFEHKGKELVAKISSFNFKGKPIYLTVHKNNKNGNEESKAFIRREIAEVIRKKIQSKLNQKLKSTRDSGTKAKSTTSDITKTSKSNHSLV